MDTPFFTPPHPLSDSALLTYLSVHSTIVSNTHSCKLTLSFTHTFHPLIHTSHPPVSSIVTNKYLNAEEVAAGTYTPYSSALNAMYSPSRHPRHTLTPPLSALLSLPLPLHHPPNNNTVFGSLVTGLNTQTLKGDAPSLIYLSVRPSIRPYQQHPTSHHTTLSRSPSVNTPSPSPVKFGVYNEGTGGGYGGYGYW